MAALTPRWTQVAAWRDRLAADLPDDPALALVIDHALSALGDDALAAAAQNADPFTTATFVAARTVPTAPVEWLALLLGAGTDVTLKTPAGQPGLGPWLAAHADAVGLPLLLRDDHAAADGAELVIAMASDATISALRDTVSGCLLGFGHRFSAAWWPSCALDRADDLALDLAAHDGRGCLSPALILTDADPDLAGAALAQAMVSAASRWPRGPLGDAEHAALRSRAALARVLGSVHEGPDWAVHTLPPAAAKPVSLPRAAQLVPVRDLAHAAEVLAPWSAALSTLGQPDPAAPIALRGRPAALGAMQRPPLLRDHDGVPTVAAIRRQVAAAFDRRAK